MQINQDSPEIQLRNILNYIRQDVWPGSDDSNAYMQEVLQKLGEYTMGTFDHSSTELTAKKLNLPCLYSDYVYPDGLSFYEYDKHTEMLSLYCIMEQLSQGYKLQDLVETDIGNPQELASKWLVENKPLLGILNKLNDHLVELNPKLEVVNREKHNLRAELDFIWGMLYRRNPEDIDWFLQTRCSEHAMSLPEYDRYIESNACQQGLELLINNMNVYPREEKQIRFYWVVSPNTVEVTLHSLGKHIDMDEIMSFGKEFCDKLPTYLLYKEEIPEWAQHKLTDFLENPKYNYVSKPEVKVDETLEFSFT